MDGADWIPYQPSTFPTPPFPEYISGHSTFSAAGAEILKLFTGCDRFGDSVTFPAGSSNVEPGLTPSQPVTLIWKTFKEAANQAGISRRYGGIHFKAADLTGRVIGRVVAAQAWEKAVSLWSGASRNVQSNKAPERTGRALRGPGARLVCGVHPPSATTNRIQCAIRTCFPTLGPVAGCAR
jgi:hypothetical protein